MGLGPRTFSVSRAEVAQYLLTTETGPWSAKATGLRYLLAAGGVNRGAWLTRSVERATLNLVVLSSPTLGADIN